jgi:hypothetical protein
LLNEALCPGTGIPDVNIKDIIFTAILVDMYQCDLTRKEYIITGIALAAILIAGMYSGFTAGHHATLARGAHHRLSSYAHGVAPIWQVS